MFHVSQHIYLYNYTFTYPGAGVALLLHHHGDQPIMRSGAIQLMPGVDTEVTVVPQLVQTSEEALASLDPEMRGCYSCQEVTLRFLPKNKGGHFLWTSSSYSSVDPELCEANGFRYSYSNCMFESAMEVCLL